MDVEVEQDDLNQKYLTSLAPEWLMHTIIWRNKNNLDTISLDDLYNHLKVYDSEVQKKSDPNSQNMAFISSLKHSKGNEDGNPTCVSTASTNVPTASASVATISQDTASAYIASQSSEKTPKALMAIDRVGWDLSYMENEREDHALVTNKEAPIEFALMANTKSKERIESLSKQLETLKLEKDGVDGKLVGLLKASKNLDNLIESQRSNKIKDGVGCSAVPPPNLDNLIESQRSNKIKDGVGYSAVPPPVADLYLSPKKDLSWTGLPEFADDTVTDYSRPSPTVESTSEEGQNKNSSTSEDEASPITPKPFVKKNFPTTNRKFPTASRNFPTGSTKIHTANMGRNGKADGSQNNIDDKGYWDSGCFRHITDNISYLSDFEPFDGGYVFLDKEDARLLAREPLKPNSVLFTDSKCIVLGRDFKLLDDANIFLRTPRQHNMYSIDLNNIVPHKDLTCLVAKASVDECILWHRNLGHLNVETMNKLVRHNLVRGQPTKSFNNDHTCTACLKGKQHKASCKSKTKDETSDILKKFITEIENLKDLKVKIIRTPQQNGVAEKRNRTLIEAARIMLADAKLLVTFWAKAINTACYVQNRVLVNKSQNKTPYELFNGRTPAIGFLKPFGCHVMILNTLDNLGKFEPKGDEGYFIGYSMSSKAFRVFNKRRRRVEENLHVEFLENKTIEKGTKDAANQEVKKDVSSLRYIALPNWAHDDLLESSSMESSIPTVSSPVPTTCLNDSPELFSEARLISKKVANQEETPSLDNILSLTNRFEDILRVTTSSDEAIRVEADVSNMETTISASPTPTLRIHKDHPTKPKKVSDALQDPSWVEAMQEELLQFKIQKVWTLVDCPKGDETRKDVDLHLYRSMIGSLMYLTVSRPDIMFAVCACARHQLTPKECHLHASDSD
nr:hypothetical protein [Tanacetum cinerariifolium]